MCIIEVLSPYCLGILGISSIAALSWYNRDLVDISEHYRCTVIITFLFFYRLHSAFACSLCYR